MRAALLLAASLLAQPAAAQLPSPYNNNPLSPGGMGSNPFAGPNPFVQQWEGATNIASQATGDLTVTRCTYQTMGGYKFAINVRHEPCPFQVSINPDTNQVRR